MTIRKAHFTPDSQAIDWATGQLGAVESKRIRSLPWSRVHRLDGVSGSHYLKQVPLEQSDVITINALIHDHFAGDVPELLASDTQRGLMLFRDHQGIQLNHKPSISQLQALLRTYAEVQAKAAQIEEVKHSLPAIELSGLVERFLEFLNPKSGSSEKGQVTARFFIGKKKQRTIIASSQAAATCCNRSA